MSARTQAQANEYFRVNRRSRYTCLRNRARSSSLPEKTTYLAHSDH